MTENNPGEDTSLGAGVGWAGESSKKSLLKSQEEKASLVCP